MTARCSRGNRLTIISRWEWPSLARDSRVTEHLIRNTAHLDQDAKRNPGDRAHPTVHRRTASTDATGSHAQMQGQRQRERNAHSNSTATARVTANRNATTIHTEGKGHKLQKDLATAEGRQVAVTNAADAGQSARDTITAQLGALPRVERSMSMSFILATPLNGDVWTRTHPRSTSNHRMRVAPLRGSDSTVSLEVSAVSCRQLRCSKCFFPRVLRQRSRRPPMCSLSRSPLRREKRSKRQLVNVQHSHCMIAAVCRPSTIRQTKSSP